MTRTARPERDEPSRAIRVIGSRYGVILRTVPPPGHHGAGGHVDAAVIGHDQAAERHELLSRGHHLGLAATGRHGHHRTDGRGLAGEHAHEAVVHDLGHVERAITAEAEVHDVGEAGRIHLERPVGLDAVDRCTADREGTTGELAHVVGAVGADHDGRGHRLDGHRNHLGRSTGRKGASGGWRLGHVRALGQGLTLGRHLAVGLWRRPHRGQCLGGELVHRRREQGHQRDGAAIVGHQQGIAAGIGHEHAITDDGDGMGIGVRYTAGVLGIRVVAGLEAGNVGDWFDVAVRVHHQQPAADVALRPLGRVATEVEDEVIRVIVDGCDIAGPPTSGPLPADGSDSRIRSIVPPLMRVTAPLGPMQKPASPCGQKSPAVPASATRMSPLGVMARPRGASRPSATTSIAGWAATGAASAIVSTAAPTSAAPFRGFISALSFKTSRPSPPKGTVPNCIAAGTEGIAHW